MPRVLTESDRELRRIRRNEYERKRRAARRRDQGIRARIAAVPANIFYTAHTVYFHTPIRPTGWTQVTEGVAGVAQIRMKWHPPECIVLYTDRNSRRKLRLRIPMVGNVASYFAKPPMGAGNRRTLLDIGEEYVDG